MQLFHDMGTLDKHTVMRQKPTVGDIKAVAPKYTHRATSQGKVNLYRFDDNKRQETQLNIAIWKKDKRNCSAYMLQLSCRLACVDRTPIITTFKKHSTHHSQLQGERRSTLITLIHAMKHGHRHCQLVL
jgi:hypothetical protein